MRPVTTEEMRHMDELTIRQRGVPGAELMDRAGLDVARWAARLLRLAGVDRPRVSCVAGKGNNGGDAFVAARYLSQWGFTVDLRLAGTFDSVKGDALTHLKKMRDTGVAAKSMPSDKDWRKPSEHARVCPDLLVDALLGTGVRGPAREPAAAAIRWINELGERCPVIAIDAPSGLNTDTGRAEGDTVRADLTVTMARPKQGLLEPCAAEYVGRLEVADIGIEDASPGTKVPDRELIHVSELRCLLERRPRTAHKGTFGHVLVVGGAPGYAGAPAMAARAAVRSGAGLTSVLVPQGVSHIVASLVPEAMVHAGATTQEGSLSGAALTSFPLSLADVDAVLIGPGMTPHAPTRALVEEALKQPRVPVVLDADALNACAGATAVMANAVCPVVLTPHPGELGRLLECSAADIQRDRFAHVRRAVDATQNVVVLKGCGTLVASRGQPVYVNMTGNPGMATGGTGDVLGGLLAGLLAQGLKPFDAARLAVYVHGAAGDLAAWSNSQPAMTACDLVDGLGKAFREVGAR